LKIENYKLKIENYKLKIENWKLKIQGLGLGISSVIFTYWKPTGRLLEAYWKPLKAYCGLSVGLVWVERFKDSKIQRFKDSKIQRLKHLEIL
jgi:hypothetical protein